MKIGITLPQFGTQATKENVVWLAKTAEEEHFDSLWVNERLLWPLIPRTPANSPAYFSECRFQGRANFYSTEFSGEAIFLSLAGYNMVSILLKTS
ncbi:MAG: hypothetical protein WCC17_25975, partial [Candidatus Nitrosopolaris sp.]